RCARRLSFGQVNVSHVYSSVTVLMVGATTAHKHAPLRRLIFRYSKSALASTQPSVARRLAPTALACRRGKPLLHSIYTFSEIFAKIYSNFSLLQGQFLPPGARFLPWLIFYSFKQILGDFEAGRAAKN
ncbi:MAG TPA: hypothetical protein VKA18_02100, partial [Alphaproteobacteria bacterium]|nr:hypothetical protein [Alphaproteobacteria bacterium]